MRIATYLLTLGLIILAMFGVSQGQPTLPASQVPLDLTPVAYLPLVARADAVCPGNAVINGGFEAGNTGWYTATTGVMWKAHNLIGTRAEGFEPYQGDYGARLGGYEGVWDVLTQTVTLPANGQLSYWWKVTSYENLPHSDWLAVRLLTNNGTMVTTLAFHDDQNTQNIWKQDVLDVSAYGGQSLTLLFESYNDNYYFTTFYLDNVCLWSVSAK
jgi:hypothetical protein